MAYEIEGRLLEVCTCNVLCPCWVGEDPDGGTCEGTMAWAVDKGSIEGTDVLVEQLRRGDLVPLGRAVDAIAEAFDSGQALLVFGNGGSAADAQHFVTEFVGRYQRERCHCP